MAMRYRMIAGTLFSAACGPLVGTSGDGSSDGGGATTSEASTGMTTSGGTTTPVPTTGGDSTGSGSSTGEPLDGPGCGVVPTCDRGELVGSMRVESSAQIEDIAGYTSVTGWLEITGSDLECLDFLACLTTVGQDVRVADNPQLRSLAGTDAIAVVGVADENEEGAVIVAHNDAMRVLAGFGSLERIESLIVSDN